jgi:hypothetical protein
MLVKRFVVFYALSMNKPKFTLAQWAECLWLNFVDALIFVFFGSTVAVGQTSPVISWLLHLGD